jgi:glutaredoxin-related protein
MISMEDEGIMLCNKCYVVSKYLIENEKPSYREPPREVSFYAYKKINHFKEILTQFQGRESTHIPSEVIEKIKLQIKKERIQLSKITYDELKTLLKKLGYNKYYEHINFIKSKLGIPCLILPQHIEDTLCNFFMEIQYPYAKHCPDYRINFLHYYYVLYKLLQIIGQTEYLKEIPMLKDKDKLIEQDIIWKKICIDLNWEFIPIRTH